METSRKEFIQIYDLLFSIKNELKLIERLTQDIDDTLNQEPQDIELSISLNKLAKERTASTSEAVEQLLENTKALINNANEQ